MTRVLLVDDEAMVRLTLRAALEARRYSVIEAGSGEEALALLSQGAVDVVVLDVNMPGMSGLDAAAEIHRRHPEIKLLLLSGATQSTPDAAALARSLGAAGVLQKPIRLRDLWQAVEEALQGAQRSA